MKAQKKYKLFQNTSGVSEPPLFWRTKKFLALPFLILLIGLSGLNLNWLVLSQKVLHQWQVSQNLNSDPTLQIEFPINEWTQLNPGEISEIQFNGEWYDIVDIEKTGATFIVHAKKDKWEYLFQHIIQAEKSKEKCPLELAAHSLWKYTPHDPITIDFPDFFIEELIPSIQIESFTIQDFHLEILKPPIA